MKALFRLIAVIVALNAFFSADGETARFFDPASIDHPVIDAGSPFSISAHPDHDPSLGPLSHLILPQKTRGQAGLASHALSAFRTVSHADADDFAALEIPWVSRSADPIPIRLKLLFPEHYFW